MFLVHTTQEKFENEGFTLKTHQMFPVHTTQEKFENEGFTLKTHQMFLVHTTQEKFENATITGQGNKTSDYRDVTVLKKLRFQFFFRSHENKKLAFLISSGLRRST